MDPGSVRILAGAFRAAAQEPAHLHFLERINQPLLLSDGTHREAVRTAMEQEREVLRRLNMLPT
jgi:hypothetical protein